MLQVVAFIGRHDGSRPRRTNAIALFCAVVLACECAPAPGASGVSSQRESGGSLLIKSTGCAIAGKRCQNCDASRSFASRGKLCLSLGEVEKRYDGVFQQTVSRREQNSPRDNLFVALGDNSNPPVVLPSLGIDDGSDPPLSPPDEAHSIHWLSDDAHAGADGENGTTGAGNGGDEDDEGGEDGEDSDASSIAKRLEALELKQAEMEEAHKKHAETFDLFAETGHDAATMQVNGRINIDLWTFPSTSPGANGFETGDLDVPPADRLEFRRLRFGVRGNVWKNMIYRIEAELAGGNNSEFRDAYFGFTDLPVLQNVLIGNQKRPYGLDAWNSARFNVFMERPFIIEAFNQDARRLGVQSWSFSEDLAWNWQYGVFNQRLMQDEGRYISNHWQMQLAGRLANTIWYDECSDGRGYAHWALSGTWADTDGNQMTENYAGSGINEARFRTRPEARTVKRWLNTGLIAGADDYSLIGLENVINLGAIQFVGEYQQVWVDRENQSQLGFQGGYIEAAYFLTGEHMPWDRESGQLDRPVPFENFFVVDTARDGVRAGWGAWQVAARGSYGDLSDDNIQGGIGESVTFGLNWLWNPWSRMQFNYIYGNIYDNALNAASGVDFGNYQIIGARFMVDF